MRGTRQLRRETRLISRQPGSRKVPDPFPTCTAIAGGVCPDNHRPSSCRGRWLAWTRHGSVHQEVTRRCSGQGRLQAALLGPGQAQIVPRTFRTHGLVGTTGSSNNLRCDSVTPKALQVLRPGFAEEMTSRQAACTACRSCPIDRPIS